MGHLCRIHLSETEVDKNTTREETTPQYHEVSTTPLTAVCIPLFINPSPLQPFIWDV